jgi:hypothetical protein
MVLDASLKIHVPAAWILMFGKTEECYWHAFNRLTNAVEDINPSYIGVDFEQGFFTQLSVHFPDAKLIGCKFHFKQAARRMMVKLGICEVEMKFTIRSKVYDLYMVIPVDLIEKGIAYIRTKIIKLVELQIYSEKEEQASFDRWDQFWEYFEW